MRQKLQDLKELQITISDLSNLALVFGTQLAQFVLFLRGLAHLNDSTDE
jgi:hypothetical protein